MTPTTHADDPARYREARELVLDEVRRAMAHAELEAFVRAGGRLEGLVAEAFPDLAELSRFLADARSTAHELAEVPRVWLTVAPMRAGAGRTGQ